MITVMGTDDGIEGSDDDDDEEADLTELARCPSPAARQQRMALLSPWAPLSEVMLSSSAQLTTLDGLHRRWPPERRTIQAAGSQLSMLAARSLCADKTCGRGLGHSPSSMLGYSHGR